MDNQNSSVKGSRLEQRVFESFQLFEELVDKLEFANAISRAHIIASGEILRQALHQQLVIMPDFVAKILDGALRLGLPFQVGQSLAPLQLLHQEGSVLQGLLLATKFGAAQGEQILGSAQGRLEGREGIVDLGGTLHRNQLLPLGSRGKTIGVELGLQLTVGVRQLTGIELEAFNQPKQLEMIHASLLDTFAITTLALGAGDVELAVSGQFKRQHMPCVKSVRH
jgi:hypothetical protein